MSESDAREPRMMCEILTSRKIQKTTKDLLRYAATLVMRGWTQGALARAKDGLKCQPEDSTAAEWCAIGAIRRAVDELNVRPARWWIGNACRALRVTINNDVAEWNDAPERTRDEVVNALLEDPPAYF